MTRNVGIFIYNDVEVLDFAGPFEVFSTAARVKARLDPDLPRAFEVFTIADKIRTVSARGGLLVEPVYDINNHPRLDLLIVPGGVINTGLLCPEIVDWVKRVAATTIITASVCTGAFVLGKAGLLDGKQATTHWEDIADLRAMFPQIEVLENKRWVDLDTVVTSAGISAGIDMSLHLVARLEGMDLALKTAHQMEFDWHSEPC